MKSKFNSASKNFLLAKKKSSFSKALYASLYKNKDLIFLMVYKLYHFFEHKLKEIKY